MSIKYELVIYWSDDDQSFIVEVPELPGWRTRRMMPSIRSIFLKAIERLMTP